MYDFVIVGGGSAGCVLANRLSADPRHSVLLIEAGPEDRSPLIHMPMGLARTLADPRHTWHYMSEPEAATAGQPGNFMRGRVLGGSSSVNGMVYSRGQPEDYDGWEADGATGWGWATFKASFRAIEDHELGDDGCRGVGGPLRISMQRYRTAVTRDLLAACAALGTPVREDTNREDQEGIGYSALTIRHGRRQSAATAFLRPARHRRNLTVVTDCRIDRIVLVDGRAVAVEGIGTGGPVRFEARGEIMLSAGVIGSPRLLQLSGIGPAAHLSALGVPVVLDRAGVGANLSEHRNSWIECRLRGRDSHNLSLTGWRLAASVLRYAMLRSGPLATCVDINGFIKSRPGLDRPDVQLNIWSLTARKGMAPMRLEPFAGIAVAAWPMRPESRGSVMLRSPDPAEHPLIRANFLATDYDRRTQVAGFRYVRAMFAQPILARHVVAETVPGPAVETDEEILTASAFGGDGYHGMGTCRMGSGADAVVDPRLRVNGVDGLRVVDCSVMPTQVSAGANGPVMALAWHAASLVLEDDREVRRPRRDRGATCR